MKVDKPKAHKQVSHCQLRQGMVLTSLKRGRNVVIIKIFYLERFFLKGSFSFLSKM